MISFKEYKLSTPIFKQDGNGFCVIIKNVPTVPGNQVTTQKLSLRNKILNIMMKDRNVRREEISNILSIIPNTVKEYLAKLKKVNKIIRISGNKGGHWKIVTDIDE
jgi:predicted HTH transcriptional regulator